MRFSMEIPTGFLEKWSPLCDLDFVLAHQVLEDEQYRTFFASRPAGRQLILDNSMHELGQPLEPEKLLDAASMVNADFVVAPDQLGRPDWNLKSYKDTCRLFKGSKTSVAVVLSGRDKDERRKYIKAVDMAAMIMLPYREPRLAWYLEMPKTFERFPWVHLLGVNTLDELQTFNNLCGNSDQWSIDTSKPVKAGICGRDILDGESLRGIPVSSKDLLYIETLRPEQEDRVLMNIQSFSNLCHGKIKIGADPFGENPRKRKARPSPSQD